MRAESAEPGRNNEGWYCCGCGELLNECLDAIERLQAIVAKLPEWADDLANARNRLPVNWQLIATVEKELREAAEDAAQAKGADDGQ